MGCFVPRKEDTLVKRRTARAEEKKLRTKKTKPVHTKYSLKGKFAPLEAERTLPTPFPTNKKGRVPATALPKQESPDPTIRLTATISGIFLQRGFIILKNDTYDKIYMSDGALGSYDKSLLVAIGDVVDCSVALESRGPRVKRIIKIMQNA
jgi:hypothetical protein